MVAWFSRLVFVVAGTFSPRAYARDFVRNYIRELVRERAGRRCEYCHLPEAFSSIPFEVDHIIAEQHGGKTVANNLA